MERKKILLNPTDLYSVARFKDPLKANIKKNVSIGHDQCS